MLDVNCRREKQRVPLGAQLPALGDVLDDADQAHDPLFLMG